ncbi:MAG TPA: transcriptional repressor LexA [Thermoanaerobaculia bacterium]
MTERQKEIVDFIRDYRSRKGVSPTQREICERFGFSSFGTLQKHIRLLLDKGALVRDWNKRRSLLIPAERATARAVELPLLGRIAAGSPIESLPGDETVSVPESLTRRGDHFVLRVRGDSMIEDGIHDGDLVVVQRRESAVNGEMVAALVSGETTLKRFFRESAGIIRLQPANERLQPLLVDESSVRIQGVVVGLMRKY